MSIQPNYRLGGTSNTEQSSEARQSSEDKMSKKLRTFAAKVGKIFRNTKKEEAPPALSSKKITKEVSIDRSNLSKTSLMNRTASTVSPYFLGSVSSSEGEEESFTITMGKTISFAKNEGTFNVSVKTLETKPLKTWKATIYNVKDGKKGVLGKGAYATAYKANIYLKDHWEKAAMLTSEGEIDNKVFLEEKLAKQQAEGVRNLYRELERKIGSSVPKVYLATAEKSTTKPGQYTPGLLQERLSSFDCHSFKSQRSRNAFCKDLIRKMERLHDEGLIHGDLKSGNIMLRKREAVLIDWDDSYLDIGLMKAKLTHMRTESEIREFLQDFKELYYPTDDYQMPRPLGTDNYSNKDTIMNCLTLIGEDILKELDRPGSFKKRKARVLESFNLLSRELITLDRRNMATVVYETYFADPWLQKVQKTPTWSSQEQRDPNEVIEKVKADKTMPRSIKRFLLSTFEPETVIK